MRSILCVADLGTVKVSQFLKLRRAAARQNRSHASAGLAFSRRVRVWVMIWKLHSMQATRRALTGAFDLPSL